MTAPGTPDRPLAGEELRRAYRDALPGRIAALERALARLPGSDEAAKEIRALAHVLRGSGTSYGYPGVTERAARTEEAAAGSLRNEGEALVAELRGILEAEGEERAVILVVEDDPEIRYLLEVILAAEGREVVTADRGDVARTILEARDVDLVVLDLVLPDTDGRALLRYVRERPGTAHIPVLVVSAHEAAAVQAECFRLGADAYFRKPFDPGTLEAAVRSHVARSTRQERESREDPVTGLLNRAGVVETWNSGDARERRTLALLELDGFDRVQARQGWAAAEKALRGTAAILEEAVGEAGRVGRWEGEAFVAVFPDGREEARVRVEAAVEALRAMPVAGPDGESFRLTASAGLGFETSGDELEDVMDEARSGLFRARTAGGNRVGEPKEGEGGELRHVIVAEDDDITASLLRHRLERDGFDVEWYANGSDAFEAALRRHPTLMILDVRMPGMDGFELLERLRKVASLQDVPVVLLTSMGSEADLVRGFRLGADDYVLKPFSPTEFLARIRRLVSRRP